MRTTITPAQMQRLEQDFIAQTGTPGILLMEMAAQAVVEAVRRHAMRGSTVLFLCGPGNNGGGGYAAAQRAGEAGIACCIMCGDNPSSLYTLLDGKSIGTLFG